jgi:formate C-acetyltransferase
MDASDFVNGAVMDFILHPSAVQGDRGLEAMYSMVRTYFDQGGYAIQGNVMNLDQLMDAKAHPEKYPTLQVRVCGWNEYFVELSPDMQDEFIRQLQKVE